MEPVLLGLLCAERVITEARTNRKTIVGTFSTFHSTRFPARFPPWFVYLTFTNIAGNHDVALNIYHTANAVTVYSTMAKVDIPRPDALVELDIPVVNAAFPEAGRYAVSVTIDGMELGQRSLTVAEREQPPKSE